MIIVKLDGGMGNQLFQYACGRYLSTKLNTELKLDIDLYTAGNKRRYALHHFNINEEFSTAAEKRRMRWKEYFRQKLKIAGISIGPYWYTEQKPGYDEYIQQFTGNVYLEGFWQSEKYFKPIENTIRKEFSLKDEPSELNWQYSGRIRSANAVSVHVRRGDYVTDKVTNAVHGVCSIDYYSEATRRMAEEVTDPHFFVFSDDIEWAKAHLPVAHPTTFIDHNKEAAHEDMRLMSCCKHHIIANSSFGWWGAWLSDHAGKKVIAPKKWFQTLVNSDIIPPGWQTL